LTDLDKGIPELNDYLINHVINKNDSMLQTNVRSRINNNPEWGIFFEKTWGAYIRKQNPNMQESDLKKLIEDAKKKIIPIVTEDGSVVVVVPDIYWQDAIGTTGENAKNLTTLFNRDEKGFYSNDIFETFILSESKYTQMQELHKDFFNNKIPYPMISEFKVDETVESFPEFINVKSKNVIVKKFIEDLDFLSKQNNVEETLLKLNIFYKTVNDTNADIFPVLKSLNEGVNLFNTNNFKQLKRDAVISSMFINFYQLLGTDDFDLNIVGKYFKKDYIEQSFKLETLRLLHSHDFVMMSNHVVRTGVNKGKSLDILLLDALKEMQKLYGDGATDLTGVKFEAALTTDMINKFLQLHNFVKQSIYSLLKTNKTLQTKIKPQLFRLLEEQMGIDSQGELVKNQLDIHKEHDQEFNTALKEFFEDPIKSESKEVNRIFNVTSSKNVSTLFTVLEKQQYYVNLVKEYVDVAKENHRARVKNNKKQRLNYVTYISLKNLFTDVATTDLPLEEFYRRVKEVVKISPEVEQTFINLGKDIWSKREAKAREFGMESSEHVTNHLIYGYVLKSYLVSIKQYIDRNVSNMANMYGKGIFERSIRVELFKLYNKGKLPGIKDLTDWNEGKNRPENYKFGINFSPIELQRANDLQRLLTASVKRPEKDVRYTIRDEHYYFRGNDTEDLNEFKNMGFMDDQGNFAPNKRYQEDIFIDDYINTYLLESFGYEVDLETAKIITKNAGDILNAATDSLYKSKTTLEYIRELPEIPAGFKNIGALKDQLTAEGFTDEEVDLVFKMSRPIKQGIKITESQYKILQSVIASKDDKKKAVINTYVNRIIDYRISNAVLNKIYKAKKLDKKEVITVNRIYLFEKNSEFLDFFVDAIRGKDKNSFNLIANKINVLGINEVMLNRLFKSEYNNLQHFINDYLNRTDESEDAIKKATLLMFFINYQKRKFINKILDLKDDVIKLDDVKEMISFETIRERTNTNTLINLNKLGVFSTGSAVSNSVTYELNKGFEIIRNVNSSISTGNNKLSRIILDDDEILTKNMEITNNPIYYKENNSIRLASDIQHEIYEPLFKEEEAGYIGDRKFQLMLDRQTYVADMMAENGAKDYKSVGSGNPVYSDIRKWFTELLIKIKIDFRPFEFIRVRDVSSSIKDLNSNKDATGFYINYFDQLVIRAKANYINKNKDSGRSVDTLEAEFEVQIKDVIKHITNDLFKPLGKLVTLNENMVKAVIALIYTKRFESEDFYKNLGATFKQYANEEFSNKVTFKQYKARTITSRIERIIFDDSINDLDKKNKLAVIFGKGTFDELNKEEQTDIQQALDRYKLIRGNYLDVTRWYDTKTIAFQNRSVDSARTDVEGRLLNQAKTKIQGRKALISKNRAKAERILSNVTDGNKQAQLFTIDGVYQHTTTNDFNILNNRSDEAIGLLTLRLSEIDYDLSKANTAFRKEKAEFIKQLFIIYPGLHHYFVKELQKEELAKKVNIEKSITNLNNNTQKTVKEDYDGYLKDIKKINELRNKKTSNGIVMYDVLHFVRDSVKDLLDGGTKETQALDTIYDLFKPDLVKLNVNSVEQLRTVYKEAEAFGLFKQLEEAYDSRDNRGYINASKYQEYKKQIEILNNKMDVVNENLEKHAKGLTDSDSIGSFEEQLDILKRVIEEYEAKNTELRSKLFKDIEENKESIIQLADNEKVSILARYENVYRQNHAYLRDAYKFIREYNKEIGIVLPEVAIDINTKVSTLVEAITKESEALKTRIDTYKNKKVDIKLIPKAKNFTPLEGHLEFKNKLYADVMVKLIVNYNENLIKRSLTETELKSIKDSVAKRFDVTTLNAENIVLRYSTIKTYFSYPDRYQPSSHNFGSKGIELDLNEFKDPLERQYAEELLSVVNHGMLTKYNDVINNKVEGINNQLKNTDRNVESIENVNNIIDRTSRKNVIKDKERSRQLFNNMFNEKAELDGVAFEYVSIDDNTLTTLINYLINKDGNNKITKILNDKEAIKKQIKTVSDYKESIKEHGDLLEEANFNESVLKDEEESLKVLDSQYKTTKAKEVETFGDKSNNLDLFKTYYKDVLKTTKNDNDILNKVIDIFISKSKGWTKEKLINFIKNRSNNELELHNATVDSIITYLNYIHQRGEEEVVIVDIETYRMNNTTTPYQITMIYRDKTGEVFINDVYINSPVFYDFDKTPEGKLIYKENLTSFYEQQKGIWTKEWERAGLSLSKEEIETKSKEKMDALILRVSKIKNNTQFIESFLLITNPTNKFKIVAHNGENFDFAILQDFISYVGKNVVVNEYFRRYKSENAVQDMFEKIDKSNITEDEKYDEYKKQLIENLNKWEKELKEQKNVLTIEPSRLKIIEENIKLAVKELYRVNIRSRVNQAAQRIGYIISDEIRNKVLDPETGVLGEVSDKVNSYINESDAVKKEEIKNIIINTFMRGVDPYKNEEGLYNFVVEYVGKLLEDVSTEYQALIGGTKNIDYGNKPATSIKGVVTDWVYKEAVGVTRYESISISVKEQLQSVDILLENLNNIKAMIEKSSKPNDIINDLSSQQEEKEKLLNSLTKQIENYREDILKIDSSKAQDIILKSAETLYKQTRQMYAKLNMAVEEIRKTGYDAGLGTDYLNTLNNQKEINNRNIQKSLSLLTNLVNNIKQGNLTTEDTTKLLENFVDPRIIEVVKNPSKLQEIKNEIQREFNQLIIKDNETQNDVAARVIQNVFNKLKEEHKVLQKEHYDSLKTLLVDIAKLKELNVNIKVIDGVIYIDDKVLTQEVLKDFYDNKLTLNQKLANENKQLFGIVIRTIKDYYRTTAFVEIKDAQTLLKDPEKQVTFYTVINEYRQALSNSIAFLDKFVGEDNKKISDNLLAAAYQSVLNKINIQEDVIESLKRDTILTMITGVKPASLLDDSDFRRLTSTSLNIVDVNKSSENVKKLNLGVFYKDGNEGNPIQILRLVPNKVYGKFINVIDNKEGDDEDLGDDTETATDANVYVFTVVDDEYNQTQQFRYDPSNKTVTFTFNYAYLDKKWQLSGGGEKGFETKQKILNLKHDDIDTLIKFRDTFYWKDGVSDEDTVIIPGLTKGDIVFTGNKDSGKDAIDVLINFYVKNKNVFEQKGKDKEALAKRVNNLYKSEEVLQHENFSINENYVRIINITEKIETVFLNQLTLLNSIDRNPTNIKQLYSGIYNTITSRYKALEPNSIVNQINPEYTFDYNIKDIDQNFLRKYNILLDLSSEGSAGAVFKYAPRYKFNFPFVLNTNPVRTTLSYQHILAKYTTVGLLNTLYKDIISDSGSNIAPGKKLLNTFLQDKYMQEDKVVKQNLIRRSENKVTQIFMPNVMSAKMLNEYKEDSIVHQFGTTVPVAFVKDPRIPLDVIAIDADYAVATGWGEGNKTWVGLHYGFKGAVIVVQDLHKLYGSYFAAREESVTSRGAAGIYGEMLFNYIRAYLIDEKLGTGESVIPENVRQDFKDIESTLRDIFKDAIDQDTNVLKLDHKQVDEHFEAINNALSKLDRYKNENKNTLYQKLIIDNFKNKGELPKVNFPIYRSKEKFTYGGINANYDANSRFERKNIEVNFKDGEFVRGYVYVFADNEHSAKSMQTITKVDTAGKLVLNVVDANNSVTKGFNLSPTVMYALYPKVGERLFEVFPSDDSVVRQLSMVNALGFANYIKSADVLNIEDDNNIDLEKLIKRLDKLKIENKLHPYIYNQALVYLNFLDLRNKDKVNNVDYQRQIEKLENTVENEVIKKLYDGTKSAYYRMNFRRWDGIRQQYLADVDLKLGEIVVSEQAWEHIVSKDTKDNQLIDKQDLDQATAEEYLTKLATIRRIEQRKEFLNSRGLFEKDNAKLWKDIKNDEFAITNYGPLKQTYAYVLSARSPVQDYGAVPVFKVIGFSKSYAAKVNVYAYEMMGADNDGDTFGMALIQTKHVDNNGALRPLLATDANYYSFDEELNNDKTEIKTTYIDKQNKEMIGSESVANNIYNLGKVNLIDYRFTRNYTGKNTFGRGVIEQARKDKSYTQIELYKQLDENIFKDLATKVQNNLKVLDPVKDIYLIKRFINVFIRMNNDGNDGNEDFVYDEKLNINDYSDDKKVIEFYNKNKDNINTLYTIETGLDNNDFVFGVDIKLNKDLVKLFITDEYRADFTEEERRILKGANSAEQNKLMKRLIKIALNEKAVINTISRIRVSKNGVNYGGNKRKDQMISSHISMYPHINLSKQGYFWKRIGAANKEGEVTIDSLISSLFFETKQEFDVILDLVKNNRDKFKDVKTLKEFIDAKTTNPVIKNRNSLDDLSFYLLDFDMVLQDVINIVGKYNTSKIELASVADLWKRRESLTGKDIVTFLQSSSKKEDAVMKVFIEAFSKNPDVKIKNNIVQQIVIQYFNNAKSLKEFIKTEKIESYADGYLKQYIIERVSTNNLSNSMSKIIAVAKHAGLDQDPNKRYDAYKKEVDEQTTKKSVRSIIIGTGLEHRIGMSINADRQINKRFKIKVDGLNNSRINKAYYDKNKPTPLLDSYVNANDTVANINAHIYNRAKMILFGNMNIPNVIIKSVLDNLTIINNSVSNIRANIVNKEDLIKAIIFFNRQGIPFYRIARWIKDARSVTEIIKSNYETNTTETLSLKSIIINNSTAKNIINLIYALKDVDYKQTFDSKYKNESLIYNFFNNVNELDETMYYVDASGNLKSVYLSEETDGELYDKEDAQNARSEANTEAGERDVTAANDLIGYNFSNESTEKIKEGLENNTFGSITSDYKTVLENVSKELMLFLKLKSLIDDKFLKTQKEIEEGKAKSSAQVILSNMRMRELTQYSYIADGIRNITRAYNEIVSNKENIKNIGEKIVKLNNEIYKLKELINNLKLFKDYFGKGNNLIESVNKDIEAANETKENIKRKALDYAIGNNIKGGILLLADPKTGSKIADATISKPNYLVQRDFESYKANAMLTMTNEVSLLSNLVTPGNEKLGLENIMDLLKNEGQSYRLVMIDYPDSDEGLYKDIFSNIRKYDEEVDEQLMTTKDKSDLYFKDTVDKKTKVVTSALENLMAWQAAGKKVVFNNKVYERIDPSVVLQNNKNLTPVMRQVVVKDIKELEKFYEQHLKHGTIIGIVNQDTWMKAMETAYNAVKLPNVFESALYTMQINSKFLSRFNLGSLLKNLYDTVIQLFTNSLILPKMVDSKDFLRITKVSGELLNVYEKISDEHTLAIMNIGAHYEDILKQINSKRVDARIVQNKINLIKEVIESYLTIGPTIKDSNRIENNLSKARKILIDLNEINASKVGDFTDKLKNAVTFVMNITFGEFLDLYDNRVIDGKLTAGLRVDSRDTNNVVKKYPTLNETIKEYDWKRTLIKEMSYFMTTSATNDYLKNKRFELLPIFFEKYRGFQESNKVLTYQQLKDEYKKAKDSMNKRLSREVFFGKVGGALGKYPLVAFNFFNEKIENAARITNFFINLQMHGKNMTEAKLDSLRRWFNYGRRSPIERMLSVDMPFFSFTIRSIDNWRDRLVNPRFWRIMSDFIDGWYGQYIDEEEKEYDDYMKFQIRSGWLPMGKNFGMRIGFGAFDVMNLYYNTAESLQTRTSPLLRAVQTLVVKKDFLQSIRQLASVQLIERIANTVTGASDALLGTNLRESIAQTPMLQDSLATKTPTLGNTLRGIFYDINEYEKYTPRRYRYPSNGRYAKYENIYKDWFNKYGAMRRPKVNPYSLVKDIQWRQYVRYRRSRNVIG
jgi:hypothetical protein